MAMRDVGTFHVDRAAHCAGSEGPEADGADDVPEQRFRAIVAPVPPGEVRPLWSVMIPTYNCARHLQQTLESVLAQDPGAEQMQIEVVDDHSTEDDPASVVEEIGRGRVDFFRQPRNVRHVGNFNACIQRSRGHLLHLLHGDDCVLDGFYRRLGEAFERHPEVGAAFCRHIYIGEDGHWRSFGPVLQSGRGVLENALERIAAEQPVQPPAMVVRREVYERLSGFDSRMRYCGEDWEMWARIAAHYPVWYDPEPLACYRKHGRSLSADSFRRGDNARDLRRAIRIYSPYLPADTERRARARAHEVVALWSLGLCSGAFAADQVRVALTQMRQAFTSSRSLPVMRLAFNVLTGPGTEWLRRKLIR